MTLPDVPSSSAKRRRPPWTPLRVVGLLTVIALLGVVVAGVGYSVGQSMKSHRFQSTIADFYDLEGLDASAAPGTILRAEPYDYVMDGGQGQRILYATRAPDGNPLIASGLVFTPDSPAGLTPPVVAWAHPTLGQGDPCAPSRQPPNKGPQDTTIWMSQMLKRGFIVTATDFTGLGTSEPKSYLVGGQEARDIVYSVVAARNLVDQKASKDYVVFGHSAGGHAALWAGELAAEIEPDLRLKGVAVAAPATELKPIVDKQWDTAVGWVIGPEAAEGWSAYYPDLVVDPLLTASGRAQQSNLETACLMDAGIQGLWSEAGKVNYFRVNPITNPTWAEVIRKETPRPFTGTPILLAQGTADEVVLGGSNALMQQKWCAAGSDLQTIWMGGVKHSPAAIVIGPTVVNWAAERFAGKPQPNNCQDPPVVPPLPE